MERTDIVTMRTPSTIGYANARLRARRAQLFREEEYASLISASTLDEMVKRLRSTPYAPHIDAASLTTTDAEMVGLAATRYFAQELAFVTSMYTKRNRRCIEVIAANQDLTDFKTIIRGKLTGVDPARIIGLFIGPGWAISRTDLNLMARQPSIAEMIDVALTLKMPYAKVLKNYAPVLGESIHLDHEVERVDELIDFELALDKQYYKWALKQLSYGRDRSKIVRWYVKGKIDVSNILIALRAIYEKEEDREFVGTYFIEGGMEVSRSLFDKMVASENFDEAVELFQNTSYECVMKEGLAGYELDGFLSAFEKRLTDYLFNAVQSKGYKDILGMGLPVAYVLALSAETINVRVIAHAKSYHIPDVMVREELMYV